MLTSDEIAGEYGPDISSIDRRMIRDETIAKDAFSSKNSVINA